VGNPYDTKARHSSICVWLLATASKAKPVKKPEKHPLCLLILPSRATDRYEGKHVIDEKSQISFGLIWLRRRVMRT
jgi:hypothetical protein